MHSIEPRCAVHIEVRLSEASWNDKSQRFKNTTPPAPCFSFEGLLEHDPEKWKPVFPRDKRATRLRGDHAQTKKGDEIMVLDRIMIQKKEPC